MPEILHERDLEWVPLRPDLTQGVFGRLLQEGPTRVVLARIAPGGRFGVHRDPYDHLFYVLGGTGRIDIGGTEHPLEPGSVIRVGAGEAHGYRNPGREELLLLSLNLPSPVSLSGGTAPAP